jgi:hypothetical protein
MAKTQGQKDSLAQERRGAKVHQGIRNTGSGNTTGHKNDVRTDEYSIEFKVTRNKSFRLALADLITAYKEALRSGREALFGIDFITEGRTYRYVIMDEFNFFDLRQRLREAEHDREYLMQYLPPGEYLD